MILSITTGGVWRRGVNYTDIDAMKELSKSGFRAFDFSFYDMAEGTPFMSANWKEEAQKIADFAAENGFTLYQAHIPAGNPLMPEDEKLMKKTFLRAFECAEIMKIPYMVMHPGTLTDGISKEDFLEKNRAYFLDILKETEGSGVNIALENVGRWDENYFLHDGKELRELIEYIGNPTVCACWDTGHANLCRVDQYESITALGKHLKCLHVADNVGPFEPSFKAWRQDLHTTPLMTVSGVNFDSVLQALIDIDYKGTFNLEIEDPRPVWKMKFIYNEREQNKLYYANDKIRRIVRDSAYKISKIILEEYNLYEE